MMMIKKRKKKENNQVSFLDFGPFLEWQQRKKNLKKIRQEVILRQLQKKDNQNLEDEFDFMINLLKNSWAPNVFIFLFV